MIKPDKTNIKENKLVPEGTYVARCYSIIHLGHVPNTHPQAITPTVNKIRIYWELPTELAVFKEGEGEKPYSISGEYTLSMNEKSNLYKIVCGWLGKKLNDVEAYEFDFESLIGKECMINISHKETQKGKTFALINSVMQVPKGMICPPQVNKSKIINWENLDNTIFNSLPIFIREIMQSSEEFKIWKKNIAGYDYPNEDINPDNIPF